MSKKQKEPEKAVKRTSIGGQALLEGVMMRGESAMALAVRSPDGDILVESKRLKQGKKWYRKAPVIRGVFSFFESLVSGVQTISKSAEVSAPEEEQPGKGWMAFAVVLGLVLGVGLFIVLPWALNEFVLRPFVTDKFIPASVPEHLKVLILSLAEGLLRMLIFVAYLLAVSLMKDIRRTFMYHGAEHRTINCFEKGLDMTVENVQSCSTRHNRCGTTFMFFVMLISILVFSLATWIISIAGLNAENAGGNFLFSLIKLGIRLALLPLVAGLSYELLKGLAKLPDNRFTFILRAPGLALQRLTTYPPDDSMADVALKAFMEVYNMDQDSAVPEITFGQFRYKELRAEIEKRLKEAGADDAEADWIFCEVTGYKRSELSKIKIVTFEQFKRIKEILTRRRAGEPLWYILGYCEFYGNRLTVTKDVLIPRPETEILCEEAIKEIKGRPGKSAAAALDLCTGSGCIALTLAKNTDAVITASDISEDALKTAAANLKDTAVQTVRSDLLEAFKDNAFDLIVSNPPYIKSEDIGSLQQEVKDFEPRAALDGGADGLDFYRRIAKEAPLKLKDGGCLMLEAGAGQTEEIKTLLEADFNHIQIIKDLQGVERIIKAYTTHPKKPVNKKSAQSEA